MKPVGMMDIRQALRDERFRGQFPELAGPMAKYAANTGCGTCAVSLVREILAKFPERVREYFPGREVMTAEAATAAPAVAPRRGEWAVYDGPCAGLEAWLRKRPPHAPSQVAVARWEDQCTAAVFEVR